MDSSTMNEIDENERASNNVRIWTAVLIAREGAAIRRVGRDVGKPTTILPDLDGCGGRHHQQGYFAKHSLGVYE